MSFEEFEDLFDAGKAASDQANFRTAGPITRTRRTNDSAPPSI